MTPFEGWVLTLEIVGLLGGFGSRRGGFNVERAVGFRKKGEREGSWGMDEDGI